MGHLVFLAGMMCDARVFAPQIAHFRARHTVQSFALRDHADFPSLVRSILPQITSEKFALVGLSMGGIAAMECLKQAPERLTRMALLDTNYRAESAARQALRDQQIAQAEAGDMMEVMRAQMFPHYTYRPQPEITTLCEQMAADLGAAQFIAQSRALRSRDNYAKTIQEARLSILVLCGAEDRLCPERTHREMAEINPNTRLRVIADCGHLSTLEAPQSVNTALGEWLCA